MLFIQINTNSKKLLKRGEENMKNYATGLINTISA